MAEGSFLGRLLYDVSGYWPKRGPLLEDDGGGKCEVDECVTVTAGDQEEEKRPKGGGGGGGDTGPGTIRVDPPPGDRWLDWLIGANRGEAWIEAWLEARNSGWMRGPTGGLLPSRLAKRLWDVQRKLPPTAVANGMHAWHAGSNAALARELGVIGAPLIMLGGVIHETPIDRASFEAERQWQGPVNHFLDSVTDVVANGFGLMVGYLDGSSQAIDHAIALGNYIPGPGEPDPRFGGVGTGYQGDPTDAWGQYP
jgi:hypothetical protein